MVLQFLFAIFIVRIQAPKSSSVLKPGLKKKRLMNKFLCKALMPGHKVNKISKYSFHITLATSLKSLLTLIASVIAILYQRVQKMCLDTYLCATMYSEDHVILITAN